MSPITTHILDTSAGRPAEAVRVTLAHKQESGEWIEIGRDQTNGDGRAQNLLTESHDFVAGTYRLEFVLQPYFTAQGVDAFYPSASVIFEVRNPQEHYHVPLLLNPFGYSTYRGS